ncbi:MAG: hypothetical protein IKJ76_08070 [Fibrobacter sp.]|nr:hypothetical protein [Fibrobacter sp.]
MKRVFLSVFFVCVAAILWACDMGAVEAKGLEDEMALLNYGEFNEDGMANLIPDAMAACNDDPECVAAMEKAAGNGELILSSSEAQEEATSSAADSSAKGSSSSAQKGPVIPSSSSIKADTSSVASSSSAVNPGSSTTVVSSSSRGSSILNGACNATPASVERGGSVTWKYVSLNSSLVIESYDWTFDEGSSITTSKDATPSVSYAAKGQYGASVTINKGLATEKTVKCTNPVEVTGIKVSGCTCTTPSTSVVVSSSKPKDVTWSVSGCTGAEPFTYAWAGGASGTEASATLTIKSVGAYAPTVTVTNSDGMTMSPTCNSVSASELPGAACNVGEHNYDANKTSMSVVPGQTFYFRPNNVTGVTGTMSMTLTGGGSSKTVSVANGSNNSATELAAPTDLGTYPYTLSVDGEEVCSANVTVEYPTLTTTCSWGTPVMPGASVQFNMNKCSGWTDAMGDNATMVLRLDGKTTNLTVSRWNGYSGKITVPDELGTYNYTVTYGGKEVCAGSVTTAYPAITSTSCALTEHSWDHTHYFTPGASFGNWDANVIGASLNMTLYHDNEEVADKAVSRYSNGDWYQYTPSTEAGTHVFRLDFHGNTVCEVEYEVE